MKSYGARKTPGTGTADAAATTSNDSLSENTNLSDMISPGRIATALSNVLRNGITRSETKDHSKMPNESARST